MIKITKKKIILFIPIILVVVYLLFYGMMYFLASVQFNNEKYVDASNYCKLLIIDYMANMQDIMKILMKLMMSIV